MVGRPGSQGMDSSQFSLFRAHIWWDSKTTLWIGWVSVFMMVSISTITY